MTAILDELAASARVRVRRSKAVMPFGRLRETAQDMVRRLEGLGAPTHEFVAALARPGLSFICEIKKASPSKGVIDPVFDYLQIARDYDEAGADAISCLTEPTRFLGSDEIFTEVRNVQQLPMIRKDFVVDEYQVYEACVMGAQAVLLICALLDRETISRYLGICNELGLDALVEAHDETEVLQALDAGAHIVGVNNRNLRDFSVDMGNASRLRELVPEDVLYVSESGVREADDIARVAAMGADAVLVGEALMRADDKVGTLAGFRKAAGAVGTAGIGAAAAETRS